MLKRTVQLVCSCQHPSWRLSCPTVLSIDSLFKWISIQKRRAGRLMSNNMSITMTRRQRQLFFWWQYLLYYFDFWNVTTSRVVLWVACSFVVLSCSRSVKTGEQVEGTSNSQSLCLSTCLWPDFYLFFFSSLHLLCVPHLRLFSYLLLLLILSSKKRDEPSRKGRLCCTVDLW